MKILVLHASALHLGFLGCYGNTWVATPHLDRLAADGVVFDQHYADNLGRRTCLTGRYQWTPSSASPQLSDLLLRESVTYTHVQPRHVPAGSDATPLECTLEAAVEALQGLTTIPPWVCWVDLPALQPPWQVAGEFTLPYLAGDADEDDEDDEPFEALLDPVIGPLDPDDLVLWERLRCTYAGAVTYLDAGLGLLFEELKNRDLFDDLTILFTGDRGLALGEHGMVGDGRPWLHDEVAHVPLILRQAHAADAGLRIGALTQPVDVAATLLDFCGVGGSLLDGKSLLPLLRGELEVIRQHAISNWQLGGAEEWSLRTLSCALILRIKQLAAEAPRPVQLYLKPEDRWEINNVIQHHLDLAEELEATLRAQSNKGTPLIP